MAKSFMMYSRFKFFLPKKLEPRMLCNQVFYSATRIDKCYLKRWNIEMQFKYYKQYLNLGKSHFRILGAIHSSLYCVAIAGLLVALSCRNRFRKISFRKAVKQIMSFFTSKEQFYF
jgi:IS4 transposase